MEQRDPLRDVLRGLNVLEMSFVNISNIGWSNHSGYIDQPRYADTIFPFFTFLSGMSRTSTRRSIGLVGLGLALNSAYTCSNRDVYRIPGVLQRLGIASWIANNEMLAPLRRLCGLPLILLWYAISFALGGLGNPFAHPAFPKADPLQTAQTKIDLSLFGSHIHAPSHDPEGLLGALTTASSMIIGQAFISASEYSNGAKAMTSLLMIGFGEALHSCVPRYFPLSKGLWTPSFVLVTSGYSILKYLAAQHMTPLLPDSAKHVLRCVGRRSLEVYVVSTLVELALLHGGSRSLWNKSLSLLAQFSSRTLADSVMSLAFTASMAFGAVLMVKHSIRLSW